MNKGEKNFDMKTMQKTMQQFTMQMEKQGLISGRYEQFVK